MLAPPDAPIYRTRAERFDDLVLQAVAQLEPRWSAELSAVEFAVEEIPAAGVLADLPDPVPLARLDSGSGDPRDAVRPASPPRIVLFRRPLLARADGDEDLAELVLDVVVEEFARLLGVDPRAVDPGYSAED
jgi:predicted Zn-dependent protease with MMP-like domain